MSGVDYNKAARYSLRSLRQIPRDDEKDSGAARYSLRPRPRNDEENESTNNPSLSSDQSLAKANEQNTAKPPPEQNKAVIGVVSN